MPEAQPSDPPPRPEGHTPKAPKPKPEPEPEPTPNVAGEPAPAADHEKTCRCMQCNLVKRHKGQEQPSATKTPPKPAQDDANTDQVRAHEASCTCSICKLVRKDGSKHTGARFNERAQKENLPSPGAGNTPRTSTGTKSGHGPACACTACTRTRAHEKQTSVEYSRDETARALWNRGKTALSCGRTEQAIRFFSQCIVKDPNAAAFFRSRGDAHALRKDHAAALADFQRAHELLKAALPMTAAPVLVKIARCRLCLGSHGPAMCAIREALSIDPGDAVALALKKRLSAIESSVEAYQNAKARRQWKAARVAYEACAKAYREDGGVFPVMMRCWEVEADVAEAKWTEALAIANLATNPKSVEALFMHALVLFLTADLGEALNQINAALKLDPDNGEAKTARSRFKTVMKFKKDGNSRFKAGDSSGAIEKWTSALNLVAEKEEEGLGGRIRAILLLNRSKARLKTGDPTDALKDVNAAGKLDPDNVKITVTRGRIYVGLELFESAVQEFKAALQADATQLGVADRWTVQSELDDAEQRGAQEGNKMKDWYEILGVDWGCTTADIRKAYLVQSLKHHPDKGGVAEKFRLVTEAYTTLSDPDERRRYDDNIWEVDEFFYSARSGDPETDAHKIARWGSLGGSSLLFIHGSNYCSHCIHFDIP
ncbi:uncharacterized protein B0H18DRAFT_1215066 [Fomitopsis serialis]|uniref:uncharacterized protein n=1 Tax=Fomitopsis serialis TaxID=139415 RepID=UPI002007FE0F|nr:uncharacterized protein B0H18DRAFT_1215066 [Neoantrodia serialis]KAH9916539.1 hypothetical protein B0H18DRAFT_1215066 [Neoantrodia serialis]